MGGRQILVIWESRAYLDKDFIVKELGETHKVEIIIRKEKEGVIQEEDFFFRRYYRTESMKPRDFSRDMRSVSRPRRVSRERSESTGNRRYEKICGSRENKREFKSCIGCKCEECIKMRKNKK